MSEQLCSVIYLGLHIVTDDSMKFVRQLIGTALLRPLIDKSYSY